ncbi:MAG: nucleoside kinase [Bacilli bacterium]|nr:nucleoside kinase [Bacilli bacterium]
MAKMIKVSFRNLVTLEVEENTRVIEIAKMCQKYFNYPIMLAKVDNDIVGLDYELTKKCDIDFYDRSSYQGNDVYSNSAYMIMILAIKRVLGANVDVDISNSIDNGVYCEILNYELDREAVAKIKAEMDEIVKEDLIFTPLNVRRTDAMKYYKKIKTMDKVKLLKYTSNSYITLYRLDDYYDYFFSKLAYSSKDIDTYKLTYIKNNTFVISTPSIEHPDEVLPFKNIPKIMNTFTSSEEFGKKININNAADLNEIVSNGNTKYAIRMAELNYENELMSLADEIYKRKDSIKVVLLAGPSSSGKTTSAKKLSLYLETKGFHTITLSTDDYFLDRSETPVDENGEFDFESIYAIDLKLFNSHLSKLLKGEKVLLPEYNFIEGKKEYKKNYVKLEENDILVIEGLHSLNEELTSSVDRKNKFKIFIAPFTQLNIDYHNRIHTSDTRRLRRIVRDNRTRGRNAADTLRMWSNIRKGEFKWIYPYQNDADGVINSALIYELAVLKIYVEPLLYSVSEDDEMYGEAIRLINVLRNILPIPSDYVPQDSVLREFIGGSGFYDI